MPSIELLPWLYIMYMPMALYRSKHYNTDYHYSTAVMRRASRQNVVYIFIDIHMAWALLCGNMYYDNAITIELSCLT